MFDKRIVSGCPFCVTPAWEIQIKQITKGYCILTCPGCGCTFKGTSKIDVISRFNARSGQ